MDKFVDGVTVECSPEEEASILAEWAENDPANKVEEKQADPLAKLKHFIAQNPDVAELIK